MPLRKSLLFTVPIAVLALSGCGGNSGNSLDPSTTPTPNVTPTPITTPTPVGNGSFPLTNITDDSNVNRAPFAPSFITSTRDPFQNNSTLRVTQITSSEELGETVTRSVVVSENNTGGNFADNIGKPLQIGTAGAVNDVPIVLVTYRQTDGNVADSSQWRAESGTLIIDSYRRSSATTEVVTFRLIDARFRPLVGAEGGFTLSVNGTTSER